MTTQTITAETLEAMDIQDGKKFNRAVADLLGWEFRGYDDRWGWFEDFATPGSGAFDPEKEDPNGRLPNWAFRLDTAYSLLHRYTGLDTTSKFLQSMGIVDENWLGLEQYARIVLTPGDELNFRCNVQIVYPNRTVQPSGNQITYAAALTIATLIALGKITRLGR